jgi:hypothetical protein
MFYKYDNGQLLSGEMITTPNAVLSIPTDAPHDGWYWFDTEEQAQVLLNTLNPKDVLTNQLVSFAAEKDIDIQEVAMLLNSSNPVWVSQAQHFQNLYLASWEAFYSNQPLPNLTWVGYE